MNRRGHGSPFPLAGTLAFPAECRVMDGKRDPAGEAPPPIRRFPIRRILVVVVVAGLLLAGSRGEVRAWLSQSLDALARLGPWGAVAFVALYVSATVALVPASILTLGAGAVYGVGPGLALASISSTLGAATAFALGRWRARTWIAQRYGRHPAFLELDRAIQSSGWKVVVLARLSPILPYTLLNYAFALTGIGFREFVAASWAGMLPGTLLYVSLGAAARAGSGPRTRTPSEWALLGVGIAATLVITVVLARTARAALRNPTPPP